MLTDLFKLQRFKLAAITVFATLIIYILLTILRIGGDSFVNLIGSLIPIIFCLLASLLFINTWRNAGNSVSKRIWGSIGFGLSLWTIAETIWGFYASILRVDLPYPSFADLFWLSGYLLAYVGFFAQYRTLHSPLSSIQRNLLISIAAIFVSITFYFVAWPIIVDFDFNAVLGSMLSIFYPLADFGLLILACLVLFSLEKGKYSSAMQLILLGFFSMAISDLGYSYADWNGIYWPDGLITLPSLLIDAFYNISYMAIALGIFAYSLIPTTQKRIGLTLEPRLKAKQNILVFIDKQSKVIRTSENITALVRSQDKKKFDKLLLSDAFGLSAEDVGKLINTLSTKGFVSNKQLVSAEFYHPNDVWVSGIAWVENEKFSGATLVIQTLSDAENQVEIPLSEEQEKLVENALSVSGTQEQEDIQALQSYFVEHVNLLHSLIDQFSGTRIANGIIEQINRTSAIENWRIVMDEGKITIADEYESKDLARYFSNLLKVARAYALNYVGLNSIQEEMRRLDTHLGEAVQKSVDKFMVRGNI